jgi:spoIIIJ-associated protein
MDWVETTGKSIEEATERALAHLGVHRDDAEVEILEEPKAGLFGRVRGEARVRARVRPSGPRPKRSRRSGGNEERPRTGSGRSDKPRAARSPDGQPGRKDTEKSPAGRKTQPGAVKAAPRTDKSPSKEDTMAEGISLAEQGSIAREFLMGLLASMNITADVSVKELDEETVELLLLPIPPPSLAYWWDLAERRCRPCKRSRGLSCSPRARVAPTEFL